MYPSQLSYHKVKKKLIKIYVGLVKNPSKTKASNPAGKNRKLLCTEMLDEREALTVKVGLLISFRAQNFTC